MPQRDRSSTEDSASSTPYMVLNDEQAEEMNLTLVEERALRELPFADDKMVVSALLEDEDDDLVSLIVASESTKVNGLNLLNVATYIVHLVVSYGVGVWGLDGLVETRVEVAQQYETLITPASWAYYIWVPILVTESTFVVAQLFKEYRARPIIQQGVSYFFFYTCLLQTGWTMFFCFKLFICSLVCVILSVISLASLLASQHLAIRGKRSREEFWLFRFCFLLHFAWMVVMASVHFALVIRHHSSEHLSTQLASDFAGMSILLPVACYFLLQKDGYNLIIPAVILWSYIGMAWRLQWPSEHLVEDYGELTVSALRQTVWFFNIVLVALLGPRFLVWICNTYYTIRVIRLGEDETDDAQFSITSFLNIHR